MIKQLWPFRKDPHAQFEALLSPHLDKLYRLAYRLSGQREAAEDLVQELLLKLYPRLEEMQQIEQLAPWLSKILYRQFIDQYRRQKRSLLDYTDDEQALYDSPAPNAQDPAEISNNRLIGALINQALDRLSEDQRRLVMLHDAEGYTLQELSELLETPVGTLKSRLSRARSRLREILHTMEPYASEQRVNKMEGQ
jgi:RNA polymerase sigma-70 factor (ECF subfamily)